MSSIRNQWPLRAFCKPNTYRFVMVTERETCKNTYLRFMTNNVDCTGHYFINSITVAKSCTPITYSNTCFTFIWIPPLSYKNLMYQPMMAIHYLQLRPWLLERSLKSRSIISQKHIDSTTAQSSLTKTLHHETLIYEIMKQKKERLYNTHSVSY
jgi:hypothetical protein